MGKQKRHPLETSFAERLESASWSESIGTRVMAERSRQSKARVRFAAVVAFFVVATALLSADYLQEDAAESQVLAMIDEVSGDLTNSWSE